MKSIFTVILSLISIQVFSQTIFSNDGKYGLMNSNNEIVANAKYDKIDNYVSFNDYTGYHLYILQKGNKYSFILKEYWETREHTNQWSVRKMDSIRLHFDKNVYDTLYVLNNGAKDFTLPYYFKKTTYEKGVRKEVNMFQTRSYIALGYGIKGEYGVITFEHKSKQTDNVHRPGGPLGSDYDYSKALYSLTNKVIHPTKYDNPITKDSRNWGDLVTTKNNKYGILRLNYNFEILPQFDSIPICLEEYFYYVKKGGMWGVVFLRENDSIPLEIISNKYKEIKDIENNYKLFTVAKGNFDYRYPACIYTTEENTILQLKFIIGRLYAGEKNIQVIDLTPKFKDSELVQDKNSEYVIATNFRYNTEDVPRRKSTFFIINFESSTKKRFHTALRDFDRFYNSYEQNRGIKSILTYQLENDTFLLQNEFNEEANVSYNVMDQTQGWGFGCIIKETILKNDTYKYEFYNYVGEKLYEITSKYTINNWEIIYNSPILEFYSDFSEEESSKRRKKTRRVVCKYNLQKKKFSK